MTGGHPKGLRVLFFTEMWERFSYYGMRAILVLYMTNALGFDVARASNVYGNFTGLAYLMPLAGGYIADRWWGNRRSILVGGLVMALGQFLMFLGATFYANAALAIPLLWGGLGVIVCGTGLFKANIASMVGSLYAPDDRRKDSAFTIFYMGINIGAFLAPLACEAVSSWLGGYRYGFMLAGAGMLLGLIVFSRGAKHLHGKGLAPAGKEGLGPIFLVLGGAALVVPAIYGMLSISQDAVGYTLYASFAIIIGFLLSVAAKQEPVVRQRMGVLVLLLVLNAAFWMGFEQAGNSLNFFAKKQLIPFAIGSWSMPGEWWQSVNAILIVILGPIFAALWVRLDRVGLNPVIPRKFGFALVGMALGFVIINMGISAAGIDGRVAWFWLLGLYFVHTMAELCISPVGLSMVTKLAPEKMTGMVMGSWFISIATGNFLAGEISSLAPKKAQLVADALGKVHAYGETFTYVVYIGLGLGITLIVMSRFIDKWMHGVK